MSPGWGDPALEGRWLAIEIWVACLSCAESLRRRVGGAGSAVESAVRLATTGCRVNFFGFDQVVPAIWLG
jgi:hypothetical protein